MTSPIRRLHPSELEYRLSPSGAPGCWGKKVFVYSATGLGKDGKSSSYTTFYRFDPAARYPAWRLKEGYCEIWVLQGDLLINQQIHSQDAWVQIAASETPIELGSDSGCEILAIVRGKLELVARDGSNDHN